ncbi:predicted protein [Sclerotinia sclerotiorum 1980 UF-70]|uniref:Major facilitator superfamily (MFS) profile domain-containing protein n=1 Tax=Sclerotinia sclerotiorum (strain ATCC 18683 / 1980 / Ss-1) TaxID=665079 RepID=A7EG15_SCLS1|nr:predicted protein [Sclerotinia sclerotiorum 1980 UF-70]EDO01781.1 predicted protein [Sclerotinia sclerotiorum 1980 UF-70]
MAMAVMILVRNTAGMVVLGAGLSLYAYSKLGFEWENSGLGFMALGFVLVSLFLVRFGEE